MIFRAPRSHPHTAAILCFGVSCLFPGAAQSRPEPAALFGDNAVLQRDTPVRIWGRADPGEPVVVRFHRVSAKATADADGNWQVMLPAPPRAIQGGSIQTEGSDLVFKGASETVISRNVVYGDVWLCSGQSNMEWSIRKAANAVDEIAAANYPGIRQFKVAGRSVGRPIAPHELAGHWVVCSPPTVGRDFTAVGYFFARDLHRRYNIPQGLVTSAWGGTTVEAWISEEAFDRHAISAVVQSGSENRRAPSGAFNAMIHPIIGVGLRGILWYQGEANAREPDGYGALFRALIADWRQRWESPALPFLFVQLPNYGSTEGINWAQIRQGQASALDLPATAMAVTIDLGEPRGIHPRNKQDVGHRLGLLARRTIFGEAVTAEGPRFLSATSEGSVARLRFGGTETDGGQLVLRPPPPPDKIAFELAGADSVFHPAGATLIDSEIQLRSEPVRVPKTVRYAFRNNPAPVLFNEAGLPAAPFVAGVSESNP
ncbi:sialate O-acetylesterase [Opitutaceae bacterium TAV5]|nr:sialate O-acetylesterase [Opitutaceae bacterium TAV5]